MEWWQTIARFARPHSLLLHLFSQELRNPSCRLFCEIQVVSQGKIDGSLRHSLGPGKFIQGHSPVNFNVGGNIGDKRRGSLLPLRIEMALIRRRFAIFDFLQDVVDLCPFNRLVTIRVFDSVLNLFKALSSDSERPNEFPNWHHAAVGVGCGGLANWRAGASQSAEPWAGGAETKPSPKILLFKLYFIHGTSPCTVAPDIDVVWVVSILTSYIVRWVPSNLYISCLYSTYCTLVWGLRRGRKANCRAHQLTQFVPVLYT
jgi:hypothetical protein